MSKIAIASTDGVNIDEHFGRAKEFYIYEADATGTYKFIGRRENTSNNSSHALTVQLLADIEVVLVKKIGPVAERELQREGIVVLAISSSIDKALQAYEKRGNFIRNSIKRSGSGCSSQGQGACGCSQGCK